MLTSTWNRLISLALTLLLLSWQVTPISASSTKKLSWNSDICRAYSNISIPSSDKDAFKTFFDCPFCYFKDLHLTFNTAKLSYVLLTDRSYDQVTLPVLWLIIPLYVYALSRAPPVLSLEHNF